MFDIQKILRYEILFYELFTNKINTEYGILYHNPRNPNSYDSNHAHILDKNNAIDKTVREIMAFYQGYGITPRIYTSFTGGELDKLQPVLEFYGFKITTHNDIFMLFQDGTISAPASRTKIRRIRGISQNILDLAYSGNDENWGDWSVKVLQKSIKNPDFHLLGLFDGGKCMSIASLYIMDGYSRVDDVKTHAGFRGRHFGTQLMTCLAAYHRRISGNYLYLRADNPIAIRMYRNIGFQDINIDARDWAAFIPPAETISSG